MWRFFVVQLIMPKTIGAYYAGNEYCKCDQQ